jgi:hypothetical protein
MLLCKCRIEFTENTIYRRGFSICSLTLSLCLYCNKHDRSSDGGGGWGDSVILLLKFLFAGVVFYSLMIELDPECVKDAQGKCKYHFENILSYRKTCYSQIVDYFITRRELKV